MFQTAHKVKISGIFVVFKIYLKRLRKHINTIQF